MTRSPRFTVARSDGEGASAACLDGLDTRSFPFVIWGPYPPFAFGSVWAVAPDEKTARLIAAALERLPSKVTEAATKAERERAAKVLMRLIIGNAMENAKGARK